MTNAETPKKQSILETSRNILYKGLGLIAVALIEKRMQKFPYIDDVHISTLNELLAKESSILLVSDHPGTNETMDTTGLIIHLTKRNRANSGVILKAEFLTGEMGFKGSIALQALAHNKVQPIAVETPKYHKDEVKRSTHNFPSIQQCIRILRSKGGLLLTFASGTRSATMLEAEEGLGTFSRIAGMVVPLTTINENGKSKIIIHDPIPGTSGSRWCKDNFGVVLGPQAFSDLVMTIIAYGQPDKEKRGFYKDLSSILDQYKKNEIDDFNQIKDERSLRMLQTYIAWKDGAFTLPANQ